MKKLKLCPCGSGQEVSLCLGKLAMRFAPIALLVGCSNLPPAKTIELDLCNARATYVIASGGQLDPAPGSPRAKLEAAEDKLCATLPR